ncbi:MAG: hypothetical protein QM760_19340 [Nibricoccus sp.]
MGTVPIKAVERIQYYQTRLAPFAAHAAAIGVTADEVDDLAAKTAAARAAYNAQQAARQNAKNATAAFKDATAAMGVAGAALIKKIRATAEQTGDRNVYALASVSPPADRSPRPAPGTPSSLTVCSTGTAR